MKLNESEVLARLRRECAAAGGQRAWARSHGMSSKWVNNVLRGHTSVSHRVAQALGIRRVVTVEWEARDA